MTTLQTLHQLPASPRSSAALGGPGRSGLNQAEGRPGGFESFLAKTGGEAEAPGAAKNLARLKAAGMHNEMLASLMNQGGGETPSASLVERANLEALLSSGRFGNLLGEAKSGPEAGLSLNAKGLNSWRQMGGAQASGPEAGLTLNAKDINAWRQKSSALSLGRPAAASEAERLVAGAGQNYLLRPPQRLNQARSQVQESPLDVRSESPSAAMAALGLMDEAQSAQASPMAELLADPALPGGADKFSSDQLDKLVQKVALALNMDPNLIKAVIKTESNFNPQAVSKAGAKGLMQLMPLTARELGVKDPFNPVENVWAGARYLKKMLDRHKGNINNALASYNWGPGNFDRHGGLRMPGETKRYITAVNKHYAKLKQNKSFSA